MNKLKITLDRTPISSSEIAKRMDFENVLVHQKIMTKPFYKSNWFYGVTGLASITLIAGSIYSLNNEGDYLKKTDNIALASSSKIKTSINSIISKNKENKELTEQTVKNKTIKPIEKKSTLKNATNLNPLSKTNKIETEVVNEEISEQNNNENETIVSKSFNIVDLYPRISGKINGNITRKQLLNNEGLVTKADVKIVSFELHLITASGGEVYNNKGNTLNTKMKSAIEKVPSGGEIYFENINGQATTGEIVRLSPLRYVLLN